MDLDKIQSHVQLSPPTHKHFYHFYFSTFFFFYLRAESEIYFFSNFNLLIAIALSAIHVEESMPKA